VVYLPPLVLSECDTEKLIINEILNDWNTIIIRDVTQCVLATYRDSKFFSPKKPPSTMSRSQDCLENATRAADLSLFENDCKQNV
jgi:hypothetical protein